MKVKEKKVVDVKNMFKEKIKNSHFHKFSGIAPEGFIMIPKKTLERFKDSNFWEEWKNDHSILEKYSIEDSKDDF